MRLTARQLNRATLARQSLLHRQDVGVVEAVRSACALQAQSAASPYIALWNRMTHFDAGELDRAFAHQSVVKATLMRITLHAVTAADYAAFRSAMAHTLRRSRLGDDRFTGTGLAPSDGDALIPLVLEFAARARTNTEFEALFKERLGSLPGPGVWWALRSVVPLVHAPTGGPWSFGDRPSYVAPDIEPFDRSADEALAVLVRRYLEAFGPASRADIGQFTMVSQPLIRAALAMLADDLATYEGPDGATLYDVRDGALPAQESPAPPRLMAMWDSTLLAYRDRSRIIPEAYRRLVIRNNGDTLPAVLVDGYVAGVWRPAPEGSGAIEVTAFQSLDDATWRGLEAEARSLVAFLADRQPAVYRRYARWWAALPAAEVRLVAA